MTNAARCTRFGRPVGSTARPSRLRALRIVSVVRRWIDASLDERSRYLSSASDHADLKRRQEAWDEYERGGSLFASRS